VTTIGLEKSRFFFALGNAALDRARWQSSENLTAFARSILLRSRVAQALAYQLVGFQSRNASSDGARWQLSGNFTVFADAASTRLGAVADNTECNSLTFLQKHAAPELQ
jgi:hypothetical protein